jgi:hypothetical protein
VGRFATGWAVGCVVAAFALSACGHMTLGSVAMLSSIGGELIKETFERWLR